MRHAPCRSPLEATAGTATWWVDGHLDLAYRHLMGRSIALPVERVETCSVSLPALRSGSVRVALGTIFTQLGADADPRWGYVGHSDTEGAHAAGV
ncbi:MAG: hypothetical protein JNK53_00855, partial [Phycisphaerae bacterium]|nr:hypothetical protein [Phycisphaerae bacterium]